MATYLRLNSIQQVMLDDIVVAWTGFENRYTYFIVEEIFGSLAYIVNPKKNIKRWESISHLLVPIDEL